jgi:hypothetical protein
MPTYDIDKVEKFAEDELVDVEVVGPQRAQEVVADQSPVTYYNVKSNITYLYVAAELDWK